MWQLLRVALASVKGNKGNANAAGVKGNEGNCRTGPTKKAAGKRSWLKRQASDLLIIKEPWLDLILRRKKTWEIRGNRTTKRGVIHLARSGGGGILLGKATLTKCVSLTREELAKHEDKHCISDCQSVKYRNIYAWVLKGACRYKKPLQYRHAQGAVIWVKAHKWFVDRS